ncbi:dihydrofolate reductase family protein [Roseisolibacter sp. H3M3-2]|uniref:dihydrofolate reductase family protein n=1 Tax=Roseisolibacter sp. H3M3-2 TaxID=3031323 RepID=UPI0023DB4339|nr:dihydrofolate reductase family protein [Roseisolibacter sp. H3M3-2]MDF1503220.1 dihydrofolate reductase family protein [Roseisolibacter sp. H3M3-2]
MRKVIAAAFVSLDGVMQAPGGPDEDTSSGFPFGGWIVPYADDTVPQGTAEPYGRAYDLLLGRKTYDIFAAHWPRIGDDAPHGSIAQRFNAVTKYVASRARPELAWRNSEWLGEDAVAAVRALKEGDGPDLLTQGSGDLLQSLFAADLVDELRLLTYPVLLGTGKRLFGAGTRPGAFALTRTLTSPTGVVVAHYARAGDVRTGSFALDP